ncbi:glucanase [Fusarium heterosporum]|uniref:Glucanase n=1 Tax=Fusarium heterosporum TaxID=42747 RepID=A0A8H5X017_FUSHE|nr:glucanase [Fusarium heterosporum]
MAMRRFFTSAVAMAAVVAAIPVGRLPEKRDLVTTITLTAASTYTATIAPATPIVPTGTATFSGTPVPYPDESGSSKTSKNGTSSGSCGSGGCEPGGSGGSGSSGLPGISYAPYRADHQCKTEDEISHDLSRLANDYSVLRIYGTECDQVANLHSCAKSHGMKLFLGIWSIDDVQTEAQRIIDGIDGDWDMVDTISVGNELVNNKAASPAQVIAAVKQARAIFRGAGYQGPVVTVDTFMAANANPELCNESDYCAVNAHAFFDAHTSAEEAGQWLSNTVEELRSKVSGNKRIVVCETGWPTQGNTNGKAVPGITQQKAALESIRDAFADHPENLILFSAFDDLWKKAEASTFMAEQHWGIDGRKSASD